MHVGLGLQKTHCLQINQDTAAILQERFFNTSKSVKAARHAQRCVDGVTLARCMRRE